MLFCILGQILLVMKRSWVLILFLLLAFDMYAGEEDTVRVEVFDFKTPGPEGWNASYTGKAHFPDTGRWRQILMVKTLKCDDATKADSFPCGEWDYLTKTNILLPDGDSVKHVNLSAFVTPYGKRLELGGEKGWQWVVDVTDYAPVLKGSREIISGNNQELLDLEFYFIEGVPDRDALGVMNVYPFGEYTYEHLADDSLMQETRIILNPEAEQYMLRARIAGHGHAGPYNCCEWDEKMHTYRIDGMPLKWTVWKDCGFNPIYPQGGTWQFDRAGWCPGSEVDKMDFDITSLVNPGDTVKIDYDIEMYSGNGEKEGKFTMSHQLFSFGVANFGVDAMLADIISPTNRQEYGRYNPSCSEAVVIIRNSGEVPLRSLQISYGILGEAPQTYRWYGELDFREEAQVHLPLTGNSGMSENGVFYAEVSKPNGREDEQPYNNRMETPFTRPEILPADFVIHIETNDLGRAAENRLIIYDAAGRVVFEHGMYQDSTTYDHVPDLQPGCYRMELYDDQEDGLIRHWWNYYEDKTRVGKNGRLEIHHSNGDLIRELPFDFGEKMLLEFVVR